MGTIARVGLVVVSATAVLVTLPVPAQAATFHVTTTADLAGSTCGSTCSLRQAIGAANANPGADTIVLPAGRYVRQLNGTAEDGNATGDLDISGDLTIEGAGAESTMIEGNGTTDGDRVIQLATPSAVTISDVTIRDGNAGNSQGGGVWLDVGSTLALLRVTLTGNVAAYGGGLYLYLGGTATIDRSSVAANTTTVGSGGGIDSAIGTLTITKSSVNANRTLYGGGGIANGGTLTLTDSTVSDNAGPPTDVTAGGGGLSNYGTAALTNVTVSGNSHPVYGGGIFNAGTLDLNDVTLTQNVANDNASFGGGGGGIYRNSGTLTLRNTIVAGNVDRSAMPYPDCTMAFSTASPTSAGHNLVGDPGDCTFTAPGDITGVTPKLGPLADNGGPTQTHALLKGSPAIDHGGTDCAPTDQRGVTRRACDIGAYELVKCQKVVVNRVGTESKETLKGTGKADGLLGFGGNDTLSGKGGNDGLCGGPGRDKLKGGSGRDRMDGGPGKDTCSGGGGTDKDKACEVEKGVP